MVAPGFLENPEVRRWLDGVEPAWTVLEFDSFNALHDEPSASNPAIRLEHHLTATEISASAVTANAVLLLRRAAETGGLKLTATGNLSRAVIDEMCGSIECPNYDKDGVVSVPKRSKRARLPAPAFRSHFGASGEAPPNVSRKTDTDAVG